MNSSSIVLAVSKKPCMGIHVRLKLYHAPGLVDSMQAGHALAAFVRSACLPGAMPRML